MPADTLPDLTPAGPSAASASAVPAGAPTVPTAPARTAAPTIPTAPTAPSPPASAPASAESSPKPDLRLTEMVTGILTDFQKLISQQVALLRAEVRSDWEKSKRAMMPVIIGALCIAAAALLLAMTGAYALHWSFSPAGTDPSRVPLWACFGIVGMALAVIGGGLVMIGTWAFQTFNPLPDETARAFEENLKALTESRATHA